MPQKPKEQDIEQVKSLLRSLEDLPRDQVASSEPPVHYDAKLPSASWVEAQRPANDHGLVPPIDPVPSVRMTPQPPMPPPVDEKINMARWFVGGAVLAVGCASILFAWQRGGIDTKRPIAATVPGRFTASGPQSAGGVLSDATPRPDRVRSADVPESSPFATVAAASTSPDAPDPARASGAQAEGKIESSRGTAVFSQLTPPENSAKRGDEASPPVPAAGVSQKDGASTATSSGQPQAPVAHQDQASKGAALFAGAAGVGAAGPSASAGKPALPDAEALDEDLQRALVAQGQQALTHGQIASARLLFRRAADSGSAEAALLLGDTFDPDRLKALGVRGVAGEIEQAIRWYEKADELGSSAAKARLMTISGR